MKRETDDQWRDINHHVWLLLKVLKKNREKSKLSDFESSDREDFIACERSIDWFLWKICLHQTEQIELAATAVTETRIELYGLINRSAFGSWLDRFSAKWTIAGHQANLWLFLRAREKIQRLERGLRGIMVCSGPEGPRAPKHSIGYPGEARTRLAVEQCALKDIKSRKRANSQGAVQEPHIEAKAARCLRACNLLLLEELGFKLRQVETALGVKHKTIYAKTEDCLDRAELDL